MEQAAGSKARPFAESPRANCNLPGHVMLTNQSPDTDSRRFFTDCHRSSAPWSPYSATSSTLSSLGDLGSPGPSMNDGTDYDEEEDEEISFPLKRLSTPSTLCSVNSMMSSYDENTLNRAMGSICLDNCSVLSTQDAKPQSNSPGHLAMCCTESPQHVGMDNMYEADQHFEDFNENNNTCDITPTEVPTCVSSSCSSEECRNTHNSSDIFCGGFGLDVTSPDHTVLFSKTKHKDRRRTVASALLFPASHELDEESDESDLSEAEEGSSVQDYGCDNRQTPEVQGSTHYEDPASHGLEEQYGETDQADVEQCSYMYVQDSGCDNHQSPEVQCSCEHPSDSILQDREQSSIADGELLYQRTLNDGSNAGNLSEFLQPSISTSQPESSKESAGDLREFLQPSISTNQLESSRESAGDHLSECSEESSTYHTAVSPNSSMCSNVTSSSVYRNRKSGVMLVEDHFPSASSASGSEPSLLDFSVLSADETIVYDWTSFRPPKEEEAPAEIHVVPPELTKLSNSEIMSKLRDHGEDARPVTATTRSVYLNLLMRLMKDGCNRERKSKDPNNSKFT